MLELLYKIYFDCNNGSFLELEKPQLRSLWAGPCIAQFVNITGYALSFDWTKFILDSGHMTDKMKVLFLDNFAYLPAVKKENLSSLDDRYLIVFPLISHCRPKRNIALSSLTVDEICDHISTFEHGKVCMWYFLLYLCSTSPLSIQPSPLLPV